MFGFHIKLSEKNLLDCISACDSLLKHNENVLVLGFPGGAVVKNLPTNAGDTGSIPGLGRSHMLQSN